MRKKERKTYTKKAKSGEQVDLKQISRTITSDIFCVPPEMGQKEKQLK